MTDPFDALQSFQQALVDGEIDLQRGQIDPELFMHLDHPNGQPRFTYVRLQRQTVTAMVNFAISDPIEGIPCFQIGVAVSEAYRSQGRAKSAVGAAIIELQHGLARNKVSTFYVEAVVGIDNEASKHVAAATISTVPVEVTDQVSGLPALHYVRKIGEDAAG
jgi:RimJ/RimL family protein N-acetyltransferase